MASHAGGETGDTGPVYVGSLNVSRPPSARQLPPPGAVAAHGGGARRARLIVEPDRILIQPFGFFFRGIFHDLLIPRSRIACIFPSTNSLVTADFRVGQVVVIEQPWPAEFGNPAEYLPENLQIQFLPKNATVQAVLEHLASQGYDIDWTPRKARRLG